MVIDGMRVESPRAGRAAGLAGSPAPNPYLAAAVRPAGVASHRVNFA
jgi:hypothetical protein